MDVEAVDHGVGQHGVDRAELAHEVEGDNELGVVHLEDVDQVAALAWITGKLKHNERGLET